MDSIEVGAGLVFHNGKLLITRRPEGTHLAGLWEFPGGKKQAEESFQECVARELLEELAIEVNVHESIGSVEHHYREKSVNLEFFRCSLKSGRKPQAIGCSEFAWVDRDHLSDYDFPAADGKLLARLREDSVLWDVTS